MMDLTVESVFRDSPRLCRETLEGVGIRSKLIALSIYSAAGSGLYGLIMGAQHSPLQAVAAALKTPLLFLLTLVICLPTLHFVGLLFGSTTRLNQTVTVVLTGISRTCILLGAFTPIPLLFLASQSSYRFLMLVHVAIFAFCGLAGLRSILEGFSVAHESKESQSAIPIPARVLKIWMLLYIFVASQTAYMLSPFVGREHSFYWFNPYPGSVLSYLFHLLAG
jgi:hypothetical protein